MNARETRIIEWMDQVTGEPIFVVEDADTNSVLGMFDTQSEADSYDRILKEYPE